MGDLLLILAASFDHALDVNKSTFLLEVSHVLALQQHEQIFVSFGVRRPHASDANSIFYNGNRILRCLYVTLLSALECYVWTGGIKGVQTL
jgi:hypothetical protein